MPFWFKPLIVAVIGIGSAHILATLNKDTIDRIAMGIVRDIGRYKAKKRRNMNTKGLISTIMKQDNLEDELKLILNPDDEDQRDIPTYTEAELYEYGNGKDGKPILIGVLGHVYDVTAGDKFYGEDGNYADFSGHDVTYSLATGCKMISCVRTKAENLSESELNEAKRWLSFFHMHDKYKIVGKMESNYVEQMMDELIDKTDSSTKVEEGTEESSSLTTQDSAATE